jgi:hypothetical protein
LRLVLPPDAVVTDRTAAWMHGALMALAPGDHLRVPEVSIFQPAGKRLRNGLSASGERTLALEDVMDIAGVRVTTPLRTACDLGRLLSRDSALASMDALLRLGSFTTDDLILELERFKGFRGIRQARLLAGLADPGAESFGESALRLRWYDACLPRPSTQIDVIDEGWLIGRLDLGDPEVRYAAEYDGEAFHGADRLAHDERRRAALAACGWRVDVFRRGNVFGAKADAIDQLRHGHRVARLRDS